jgi:hypothetical protein
MSNQRGFCSNCGAQVVADARFCEACGEPVAQIAVPPTPPLQPAQIIAPPSGATSAPMMWAIGSCAVVSIVIAILAALALSGYVLSQQGSVSQARGTITRTVMPSVPLPIATTPVPAVTTSIAVVPLVTPSLTQPAAQTQPLETPSLTPPAAQMPPSATPSLTQPAAQVSPSPSGATYDLYVRRIDYQPTGANLVAGQPIRFNIMIATDIYPPAGPLFPTSRFRWRPGSTYNWTEAFCPADTHYAKCDSTFEFTYDQPGTYEFEVEADQRGEIAETNKANNRGSVTIQVRQAAATAPPTAVPSTPVGGPVPGAISVFFTIRDGSPTGWVYDKQGIKHTPAYNTISGISVSPGDRIVLQTDTARFSLLFDCSTTPGTFSPCDFSADSTANLPREIRAVKNGMSAFLNISRADNWAGVRPGFAPQRYPADPILRILFSW